MAQAAGDALDQPIYGSHYLVSFPILDADGDPVTGATGLDSEVSIDLGTFTDCTNEATELATSSGVYYLYLTGAEMTGKIITVRIQTTSAGAKTTVLSILPVRMQIITTGTAQAGAASTITLAASTSKVDNDLAGYYVRCNNNSPSGVQYATRKIISNVASTQVATVESAWGTNPSSATTYDILAPVSVNVNSFNGTLPAAIATAGYPDVNVKKINNVSTSSVTTINAHQGTTLAVTFGGANGSSYPVSLVNGTYDVNGEYGGFLNGPGVTDDTITLGHFIGNHNATMAVDGNGRVDVIKIAGTTQTARDIGASVLLSTGTGTGQLDFTSGVVKANATQWLGGTIPAVNVTGVPLVDAKYLLGTVFATPATAGIPDVNAKKINNVATTSVTTISAFLGTTIGIIFGPPGYPIVVANGVYDINGDYGGFLCGSGVVDSTITLNSFVGNQGTTMAVDGNGRVDVSKLVGQTVTAAAGVTFPASVASPTNITAAAGVVLASTGLDSISTTPAAGVPSNFREFLVWGIRRFMKKFTRDTSDNTAKAYADDGSTVLTTQTLSTSGTVQTQSAVS